ncbi:hypothetical protein [Rugamonas sp.]|uniref:DUF7666 domain-containing protein n=1 Tax=Rugamonas sp. TaxID=1926287 RepID=UPI0025F59BB6|nr:hypothetical protein [Rugamonas sp.]
MSKAASAPTALVLRTCRADMASTKNFAWPQVGERATAADWNPKAKCGNGLHGWLYGQGDHECSNFLDADSKWLVVEVAEAGIVMLGGKCKFESGIVRFVGDKKGATKYLMENEPRSANVPVIGASINVGDHAAGQVGALGSLTGGNRSTLTGGNRSTLTGGNRSTLTGGNRSTLTIKYWDVKKGLSGITGGNDYD